MYGTIKIMEVMQNIKKYKVDNKMTIISLPLYMLTFDR